MRVLSTRARLRRACSLAVIAVLPTLLVPGARSFAQGSAGNGLVPPALLGQQPPPGSPNPSAPAPPAATAPARRTPTPATTAPAAARVIARVGGREVTQAEFDRVGQPYFAKLKGELGAGFTPELQRMANFNVFDELVRRECLAIEAQRQNVQASPGEIDSMLMQDPFFQTNGRFDPLKFQGYKSSPGSNYLQVLPRLREMAVIRKLDLSLQRRFAPTPAQLRAEWSRRNDQVRFKMLPVLTREMPLEPEASEAEWAAYFKAHPDQFVRKTRIRLRYARLALPPAGDSTRAAEEARVVARGTALADSLRHRTAADSSAEFTDTGLFEVPSPFVPGLGRVAGLSDTLARTDSDSTIRVVGPYVSGDAVYVGVIAEREPKRLPAMREVLGDLKRRADIEKRRTTTEAERRAYYEANRATWRSPRVTITRVSLNSNALTVPITPQELEKWYAGNWRVLLTPEQRALKTPPALTDSLREVARGRMADEQRPRLANEALGRVLAAWRAGGNPRVLAKGIGAAVETLGFARPANDTLCSQAFLDTLLLSTPSAKGTFVGPRDFGARWIVLRIDGVDTTFVPAYEAVRSLSDAKYAEVQRQKDEAEGRTYFDAHRDEFRTAEKYALESIAIPVPPADSVKVPDAEVRRRYDANPQAYRQEEQVQARHILFMTRGVSPEADRALKARADSLLAAIRANGGDFAELAKRFSQEPGAATSGGDLGWFGRNRMVREFETAAFALKPGEVSNVVKTQFGYHIIKLEGRRAAGIKPFADVQAEIRTQLAQSRGDSTARRTAETLRRRLAEGGDEKALAAANGGIVTAPPIGANEPLPTLGFAQGLAQDLPTFVPGRWAPKVYRTSDRWVVLRLREKLAPRPAEFDEVKTQAVEANKNAKRRALLTERVTRLRAALAAGASLDSLAAPYGGLKDSGLLGQSAAFVPILGNEPRLVQKAFELAPGAVSDTLQVSQGVVWLKVDEKKSADAAAFKAASPLLETELTKKKYDEWVEEKKKSIRIEILRPDLRGPRPGVPRTAP